MRSRFPDDALERTISTGVSTRAASMCATVFITTIAPPQQQHLRNLVILFFGEFLFFGECGVKGTCEVGQNVHLTRSCWVTLPFGNAKGKRESSAYVPRAQPTPTKVTSSMNFPSIGRDRSPLLT